METFFTTSDKIQNIIKSLNLTKTLFVSSIIIGEANTGKKTLIRYLFPNAKVVSGKQQEKVKIALEHYNEIIITDFEKLTNPSSLNFSNKRIIATANYLGNPELIDTIFSFIYQIPPLRERPGDVIYLRNMFIQEIQSILMIEKITISHDSFPLNLTLNSKSLKKSIYQNLIKYTMTIDDISEILYSYFYRHFDGNDNYRAHLKIYEKPLIKAGLKKYNSQLQLSKILGINRNTLRKKIHEHGIEQE